MLKAEDITPGRYKLRDGSIQRVSRVWMGVIYGSSDRIDKKHPDHIITHKHVWFAEGCYNLSGNPHNMDLMERVN